ncbi:MAG: hypothetical protein P4M08_12960 [Oligoflexia bacterium]|nr:hypothetical protein [Oligoflexia bacterium]
MKLGVFLILGLSLGLTLGATASQADTGTQDLSRARALYSQGDFFLSARYAFGALDSGPETRAEAYSWVTLSLVRAGMYNAASYFFIKTLETDNRNAIRRVLTDSELLLEYVGADVLRKYLVAHSSLDDYNAPNRSALLYALGKEALLAGDLGHAMNYLSGVRKSSWLWPYSLELLGTAYAIQGEGSRAIDAFGDCADNVGRLTDDVDSSTERYRQMKSEAEDLTARCQAGKARTLYQLNHFDEADQAYDRIQKSSIVWPDILFEQAWNSFARGEYNRSLGKLVSYKSPALSFVFNPEVDVLRAQSYLALCYYSDASEVINEFNSKYAPVGEEVKRFVEEHANDPGAFYSKGKEALSEPISSDRGFNRLLNRFVRGPYMAGLIRSERQVDIEAQMVRRFERVQQRDAGQGLAPFLSQVLSWRRESIKKLGGLFVKNSLLDYHSELISNYEKMSFINLEMLKRAKEQLIYKHTAASGRKVGTIMPKRRDYQYYWSFNGEFWSDELGDYVFGLQSQCNGSGTS